MNTTNIRALGLKVAIASAVALSLLIAPLAYAQEPTAAPARPFEVRKERRVEIKEDIKDGRVEIKERMKERHQEFASSTRERREETKENIKELRAEFASTTKERRHEFREDIKKLRVEFASTTQARRDAIKANVAERVKEQVIKHVERIERRLTAAIERFENLSDRMASRIEKLEEKGVDMTNAKALLATADAAIAQAETEVEAIGDALEQALQSENPKEAFTTLVRPAVTAAEEAVKEAHKALVEALRAVKAADPDNDNASSTPQS